LNPFEVHCRAQITAAAVRRIRQGHLWVYAGELEYEPAGVEPITAQVVDSSGNILGYAFYSRASLIRLRLFSRDPEPPSLELIRTRIKDSIARRQALSGAASACRLIFGESDLLPGIIVDRYGDWLVLQTLTRGADAIKLLLVDILQEELKPAGILQRNDVKARRLEGLEEIRGVLRGTVPEGIEIVEDGIRFIVNVLQGQKTGFFLDQSENRIAAARYASGQALDCFSNTGGFALHFARRCESVLAVDISPASLSAGRRNSEINEMQNIDFVLGNAFDFLREMESAGRLFDTICLDPPAFAKNRKAVRGARSGYKEVNLRALKLLKPDGILVTSSCSYHMSETDFFDLLCDAARDCRRFLQILERRGQASDHPVLAGMPETRYLKCFILRAL
jgi:23S rRNA (cytosine1962-C5)-methyltransferase